MRTVTRLAVVVALASIPPAGASAEEPPALNPAAEGGAEVAAEEPAAEISPEARAILARLEATEASPIAAAVELGASHPWPKIVEALGEVAGDFRHPERPAILMSALARMDAGKLQEMLRFAAQEGADSFLRIVALQTAAKSAGTASFEDVLNLAAALSAPQLVSPSTRQNVREALFSTLDAAPAQVETLRNRWGTIDTQLRAIALEGLEKSGPRLGTRAVSRLLGTGAEGDHEVLLRLASMPILAAEPFATGTEGAVLRSLASSVAKERAAAALVAGRIGGVATAERLVEALADADPSVVAAAGRALCVATGVALVPDAALWRVRLDEEVRWLRDHAPADREALGDADATAVVAVLGRLALHRLHRDEIAPWVERCLDHHEPVVRKAASRALARLGRPASVPPLLAMTQDPAPDCALGASAALAAITGVPAPKSPGGWSTVLSR